MVVIKYFNYSTEADHIGFMYIYGRTLLYLFQFLYHMVFELEDLQHFPVPHLSFVLLTSRKRKIIRQAFPNLSLQLTITSFIIMNFWGRQKQVVSWGPVCFNSFKPPGATHSLHSSLLLQHIPCLRPPLTSPCLFWSCRSPGRHWNKYVPSLEEL